MNKKEALQYLQNIAKKYGATDANAWKQQGVHKLAALTWMLDRAGIKDQALRNAVRDDFLKTPTGFGCNASALNQWIEKTDTKVAAAIANLPAA